MDPVLIELGPITIDSADAGYRRHVYSSLVRVVNPAGRRENP